MTLPGAAAIPAPDARRALLAEQSGARAVAIARTGIGPSDVAEHGVVRNAIRVLMAIGGSTNAVIHLTALGRRVGLDLTLDVFEEISRVTPVLVDLRPSGTALMEDFFHAGGVPALLSRLQAWLEPARDINGSPAADTANVARSAIDSAIIRPLTDPIWPLGAISVLRGNLCPDGALIKQSAATPALLQHTGRAVVFEDRGDLVRQIDDPSLGIDEDFGPGPEEWRPKGRARYAGMGTLADPASPEPTWRDRPRPNFGCPDERDFIRNLRRSCRSRVGGWWAARCCSRWRFDRT